MGGNRLDHVNHKASLKNLIPEELGGLSAVFGVDELHSYRSGVSKVMTIGTEPVIHRYMTQNDDFISREDVSHLIVDYCGLIPSYFDGSRRMLKLLGEPLNIPKDTMAADKWESAFLKFPYFLVGNGTLIEDCDVRATLLKCYSKFTEAWAYIKASDEA